MKSVFVDFQGKTYLCQHRYGVWRAFHTTQDGRYFEVLTPEVFDTIIRMAMEQLAVQRLTS